MMFDLFNTILSNTTLFWVTLCLFALCVGSFLNVVIYRFPIMLKTAWQTECQQYLNMPHNENNNSQAFNLFLPRSQCPNCKQTISMMHNIPLISFILLRGQCAHCQARISWRYPLIEFITLLMTACIAWQLGATLQTLAALVFSYYLLVLAVIDYHEQLLPDVFTLSLLWFGLMVNSNELFVTPTQAIYGAVFGYLSLWSLAKVYQLITHKEGMAAGDMKLLAAIGAWLGWQSLLPVILIASLTGSIVGMIWLYRTKQTRTTPIPFGPFLAAAGFFTMLYGPITSYL